MIYTDPGSGMMLLQILLAFGASALFYFRKYFSKVFGRGASDHDLKDVGGSTERGQHDADRG